MTAKTFWNRVKALLKQKKITEKMAADKLEIPLNTWRGWNSKGIIPSLHDCIALSELLKVSLDYLAYGKERNPSKKIEDIQVLLKRASEKLNKLK